MFPALLIQIGKLRNNIRVVTGLCRRYGVTVTGVTKMFCGNPVLARVYVEEGLRALGDSRVENLKKMASLKAEKWLIRAPTPDEAEQVVRYADVSLNSEITTIRALNREAKRQNRVHRVILMADLGDLREGYVDPNELAEAAREIDRMESVELYGVGTNLNCFSFVHADSEKMRQLCAIADSIPRRGKKLIVSGGNSSNLDLMLRGGMPPGVNNLRLGEALLFGRERSRYRYLDHTFRDVFVLQAEIIELKEKPSRPWGEVGVDSYGRKPSFEDRGVRLRAICAAGRQDLDVETTWPEDEGVQILGASSDHLVLDVSQCKRKLAVGDTLSFRLGYFSALRAFTSSYVIKDYLLNSSERDAKYERKAAL